VTIGPLGLLAYVLVVCAWCDYEGREIPFPVLLTLACQTLAIAWLAAIPLSLPGAIVGYAVPLAVGMPGGDQKASALAGAIAGVVATALASLSAYVTILLVFETLGKRRSLIGVPCFPIIATWFFLVALFSRCL